MMRYKKQGSVIVMLVLFCGLILCFHLPANAKQNIKINRKKVVLTTGKSKKLELDGVKKKQKIRWKSSDRKVVTVSKNGKIRAKKNGSAVVTARYQNKKYKCKVLVVPKAAAKQAQKEITPGTSYYRGFLVDNVYHSGKNGDIHYNVYFPDSYDGKKKMALYVTLPGYQGLYFQGVAENIKTEDFGFEAQKYNSDMVILAPQLDDWGGTSADQTIALVEYFLSHYPIDASKVYINGYSGGGETLSLVLGKRPELFTRALMCSSQWDGEYEPVVKAKTPVYFVIGESDEYYSSEPFKRAYQKLHDLYRKQGLCEKQIENLLVLDVKGSSYFQGTGITYQHGGGYLFCRDKDIMSWLFKE
ncbi:MAG: prolyl oligopeptidase family serine peptidase [Lachnospiraceae bacterium]|uniref:prolyl oligopeptidase family serine peptidase n=1 Tax=Parablautia intestinalis TaxID=2320100 RepID=UPI00259C6AEE|nr:prolyl oligopeptidase family serine peptidase [Parablautia intestinalis]MCI9004850.1 prolyl oligopeptidase family serine peptidase [Lachnospiraceae bacterium]